MSLAGGQGSVTVKNATLYSPTTEKQVAVRHCNGRDIWIVSHEWNSNKFRAYLLTSAGLNTTPVITAIGETYSDPSGNGSPGQMKISPDGKKLAVSTETIPTSSSASLNTGGFHLFDFDAATGIVSNSLTLINKAQAYGVEFSPDGTKVYGTTFAAGTVAVVNAIYQWNVCASNTTAIVSSEYSLDLTSSSGGGLQSIQRAIDGKIYVAIQNQVNLHVINNPNASGAAMNFSANAISISPQYNASGLPNFINFYTKPAQSPFTNTINCQNVKFSVPPLPTFTSGCSTTPYPPSGYLWDFGDAASGAANSSTLTNPMHYYSTLGTYTVSLILQNACTNDTLKQIVNVTIPGPTVTVSGITTFCKGDRRVLNAAGANTYSWSNSASGPAATFSPTTTTVYSVTGTATNSCTSTNVFTITVNPCLDVASAANNSTVRIYPNPAHESLHFISEEGKRFNLTILNSLGQTLIEQVNFDPSQELDVSVLPEGIYFVSIQNGEQMKVMRLLKD
jgi:PKD repeat protein